MKPTAIKPSLRIGAVVNTNLTLAYASANMSGNVWFYGSTYHTQKLLAVAKNAQPVRSNAAPLPMTTIRRAVCCA